MNLTFDKHIIRNLEYQFLKDTDKFNEYEEINMHVEIQHSLYIHKDFESLFLKFDVDIVNNYNEEEEFRLLKVTIDFFYYIKKNK